MHGDLTEGLVTLCVFAFVGWAGSRQRKRPVSPWILAALGIAMVVGFAIGKKALLVSVLGINIFLNLVIASCCFGLLVGFIARNRTLARQRRWP